MLKPATRFPTLLFTIAILSACSTRVEYEPTAVRGNVNAININTATVDELEKLPYIGRRTAETIVEFRTANGPFRRPEHLLQIRGISEERFADIRPLIKTE